jgi:hypothetical protein
MSAKVRFGLKADIPLRGASAYREGPQWVESGHSILAL